MISFFRLSVLVLVLTATLAVAQTSGTLSITSTPGGCWVRIDSVLVGKTPLETFRLPAGRHSLQVFPENAGNWYVQEQSFTVNITANQDTSLTVVFSEPVKINSVPFAASLFHEDRFLGKTPLNLPYEPFAKEKLRLEKEGFTPYIFTLADRTPILAHLDPDEAYTEDRTGTRLLGFIPRRHLASKFTLLTASVATHWLSFYFKNEADSNYERYRRASDPAEMDRYWDRTNRYDRFSEVALGASFVALAGLIYMVVWH